MAKKLIFVAIPIAIIITFALITNYIDSGRVVHGEKPKFTIKIVHGDGSKITYLGLGYKVVAYTGVSPKEPYELHPYKQFGSWFMKYEKPNNNKTITNIDDFYKTTLTEGKDIKDLTKNYAISDAKKDGVYTKEDGINKAKEFVNNVNKNVSSYKRVARVTKEGDIILYDVLYNAPTKQLLVVIDNTRDRLLVEEERKPFLIEYDKTEILDDNQWVVYQGDKYDASSSSYKSLDLIDNK